MKIIKYIPKINYARTFRVLSYLLITGGLIGILQSSFPAMWGNMVAWGSDLVKGMRTSNITQQTQEEEGFGEIVEKAPPLGIEPINTTNSIIITKIDVNSPIIWDVGVENENDYRNALNLGVAHASGTSRPSENPGNTYLFAHSTPNPRDIQRYSAVFTFLNKLEIGEMVTIFSDGKRYDYQIEHKEVVDGFNQEPLIRQPDYPMLTMQTCDPPGVPINRLIVTARLYKTY